MVERYVELYEQGVHQHQIPQGEVFVDHALGRKQHQRRHRCSDDKTLPDVQEAERRLGFHGRTFVIAQVVVVAPRLELLVVEILHRLVIEQAVDGAGIGLGVQFVGLATDVRAPLGDPDRESDVDAHRRERDHRKAPVKARDQHPGHQDEFQNHRQDRKQHVGHHRGNAACAPLNVARDAARLALQMEAQRQGVQVTEDREGHAPDCALRDPDKNDVTQFREQGCGESQESVGRKQRQGHGHKRGLGIESVHNILEDQGHAHVRELRDHQEGERECHAIAVFPEVGQQERYHAPFVAAPGRILDSEGCRCGQRGMMM